MVTEPRGYSPYRLAYSGFSSLLSLPAVDFSAMLPALVPVAFVVGAALTRPATIAPVGRPPKETLADGTRLLDLGERAGDGDGTHAFLSFHRSDPYSLSP